MTRFARAKGSKASNERREEEATPWQVMRQQLVEQSNSQQTINVETNEESITGGNNNTKTKEEVVWSQFEEPQINKKSNLKSNEIKYKEKLCMGKDNKVKKNASKLKSSKMKSTCNFEIAEGHNPIVVSFEEIGKASQVEEVKVSKKHKANVSKSQVDKKVELDMPISKEEKVKKKVSKTKSEKVKSNLSSEENKPIVCSKEDGYSSQLKENKTKKKCKKDLNNYLETVNIKRKIEDEIHGETDQSIKTMTGSIKKKKTCDKYEKYEQKHKKPLNKNFKGSNINSYKPNKYNYEGYSNRSSGQSSQDPYTIIANGREIQIVRYDGFLVKNDDAIRLMKLRRRLRENNVSKEKIKEVMKLERRKAEKALAREKTNVCFHCRKFGHNFSDCPDIKDPEMSKSGMCFKCGSMEHTYFQCKVLQSQDFRYAVCFVCKEQGHIARQCPLNSQGQYPKGGSCHVCGEVTHLKKDCPKAIQLKSSDPFTVGKINNEELEEIGDTNLIQNKTQMKKKKIVTF